MNTGNKFENAHDILSAMEVVERVLDESYEIYEKDHEKIKTLTVYLRNPINFLKEVLENKEVEIIEKLLDQELSKLENKNN